MAVSSPLSLSVPRHVDAHEGSGVAVSGWEGVVVVVVVAACDAFGDGGGEGLLRWAAGVTVCCPVIDGEKEWSGGAGTGQ